MAMVIEYKDNVELTKALMMVLEFGEDSDGQIVFYSNCRHFSKEMLNDNGGLRGIAFGVEEFPDDPYVPAGEPRSAN
jgi:hypothetical protein